MDRIDSVDKCSITEQDVDQDVDLDMDVNQYHDSNDESDEVQKAEDDFDQENIPVLQDQSTKENGACDVAESDLISFAYQLADGMVCVYIMVHPLYILTPSGYCASKLTISDNVDEFAAIKSNKKRKIII